jgi:hypothetical protein
MKLEDLRFFSKPWIDFGQNRPLDDKDLAVLAYGIPPEAKILGSLPINYKQELSQNVVPRELEPVRESWLKRLPDKHPLLNKILGWGAVALTVCGIAAISGCTKLAFGGPGKTPKEVAEEHKTLDLGGVVKQYDMPQELGGWKIKRGGTYAEALNTFDRTVTPGNNQADLYLGLTEAGTGEIILQIIGDDDAVDPFIYGSEESSVRVNDRALPLSLFREIEPGIYQASLALEDYAQEKTWFGKPIKYVNIVCLGKNSGGWAEVWREVEVEVPAEGPEKVIEIMKEKIEEEMSKPTAPAPVNLGYGKWNVNPDYVGKPLSDFIMPDELKGEPVKSTKFLVEYEPNVEGIVLYKEAYYLDGKIIDIGYYFSKREGVSLMDTNRDGIIDYVSIVNDLNF